LDRLIPKHKANSSLDYQIAKRVFWNVNYQFVDNRNDAFFDGNSFKTQNLVLDSYQLVNSTIRYELLKNSVNVFGTVNNIFNTDYIENIGYNTLGKNFKLGLTINL
jgi:vitamin B12 transporter